jgi:hypothetical protein
MKPTAIGDVIPVVVASLTAAVSYPVFDGPPSKLPGRDVALWLAIGAQDVTDQVNPTTSATSDSVIHGLGQVATDETLHISCVAVGKAVNGAIADARAAALSIVQDVGAHLAKSPTGTTYGVHVSNVDEVRAHNRSGGAVVQVVFTITAYARLT